VADITYLPTDDKFVYLSLVTDAHSRKIVGWHVHERPMQCTGRPWPTKSALLQPFWVST
jgi:transposase InsO family protein